MTSVQERPVIESQSLLEVAPTEIIFGAEQLTADLDVDSLIMVHQIRDKDNTRFAELKDSIREQGLDNAINVARLTAVELGDYLQFVNETWGSAHTVDDFATFEQADGRFNLVVAGHNRAQACKELADEYRQEHGQDVPIRIRSKLLKDNSVGSIVAKQYSENIHEGVKMEREAMIIVELYRWGLGTEWMDSSDFRTTGGSGLSKKNFDEAMAFYRLPNQVRSDIFARRLPYKAGIELGKLATVITEEKRQHFNLPFGPLDQLTQNELDKGVTLTLLAHAAHISRNKGMRNNASAANRYLASERAGLVKRLDMSRVIASAVEVEEGLFEVADESFSMCTPAEQARNARRAAERELARVLKDISQEPHAVSTDIILTYGSAIPETRDQILADIQKSNQVLESCIVSAAEQEVDLLQGDLFDDDDQIAV